MEILSIILLTILGIIVTNMTIKEIKKMGEKTEEIHHKEILLKNLEIENSMLEKEIKQEIKKQIEEDKKHEELDNFLDFLQKRADQLKEQIEKEIEEIDD